MNILLVTTSFPLTADSTSGIFILRLLKGMPDNLNFTVLTPAINHPVILADHLFKIKAFRYAPYCLQNLAHAPGGIMAALKKNKLNVVLLPFFCLAMLLNCIKEAPKHDLIHANWSINGVIAGIAGIITRKPVITTLRGSDVNLAESSFIHLFILKLCLAISTKVTAVSQALSSKISFIAPQYRSKIYFIPNGVNKNFQKPDLSSKINATTLITSGNLVKGKGIDIILKALANLQGTHRLKLKIIGDGPELNNLKSQAVISGIEEQVEFHGSVSPDQIEEVLGQADIFILASLSEGRPNVIFEAMAAGLAIIASRIDGITEIIEHGKTGLLFRQGDAQELTEQLALLLEDKNLQTKLTENARQYIYKECLSWEESAEKYLRLYEECSGKVTYK